MALERVAELVRRAARNTGVFQALRNDPADLRSALGLTSEELSALHSATAFPTPASKEAAAKLTAQSAQSRAGISQAPLILTPATRALVDVPDGGSLLPPEGSGMFTGATGGFAFVPPRADPGANPLPPVPGILPPSPPTSPLPPMAPQPPTAPYSPQVPPYYPKPPVPIPPGPTPQPCPQVPYQYPPQQPIVQPATRCGCEYYAIAGMVSAVSSTAITAITSITAIAGMNRQR